MKRAIKAICWTLAFVTTFLGGAICLRNLQIAHPLDSADTEEDED